MHIFTSILVGIATLFWSVCFIFLILNAQYIMEGIALLGLGVSSFILLTYCIHLIYKRSAYDQKLRFLQQGLGSLAPAIEGIMFDNKGNIAWTTHPNGYPSQQDFLRKLLMRVSDPAQIIQIQNMIEKRQQGEVLIVGGGNGSVGQDKRWWLFSATFFDKASGVMILRDVTAYCEGYAQLKDDYAQLEKFIDEAPFGVFYSSAHGRILGVNQTFSSWVELPKDQLIGKPVTDFIKDEDLSHGLVQIHTKHGSLFNGFLYKPLQGSRSGLKPSIVSRIGNIGTLMGGQPLQNAAYFEAAIPAIMINQNGVITSSNAAFRNLIGEMNQENFYDLVQSSHRAEVLAKIKRTLDHRSLVSPFELRFEGDKLQATVYISRPWSKTHNQQELMLQFIDISEQKRLEGQFIQSQKMQAVGQLAGGIAHDFNNLLTAMIGYCDLLLQRCLPNDPSYNDVMQIRQNANRAANLVRQLLAFSRRQTLQPKVVVVTDHLVELSTLVRRLIGADIDLKMIHARDLWLVKVDIGQLEQVIINLVVNARDAMKSGGTLTIRTDNVPFVKQQRIGHDLIPKGDYVAIEVIDTGCGISAEHLEYIFEPFFSTKEVGAGTGLGLSTVYGIVKQTGGFVLVDSKMDEGTTFRILLPRYMGIVESELVKSEQFVRDLTGVGTILLVEDEDPVRMFSARALREKGYRVIEASSGEAALELVEQGEQFDLLVTDVVMSKMDGPTLSKKIRDIHPDAKTIFISGYTEDTFRKDLDHNAKIHFLPKPFTLKDLALKVKEVLSVKSEF